jgi:hypothetical protein
LVGCLHFSFQWTIHFILKLFCNNKMVFIHIFFNFIIPFAVLYKVKPFLAWILGL